MAKGKENERVSNLYGIATSALRLPRNDICKWLCGIGNEQNGKRFFGRIFVFLR